MNHFLDLGIGSQDVTQTSDDYYTPKWVFDALDLTFDTDPAQPVGGCDWIPVKKYYTILDDGLKQDWVGRVWLNPPYSKPAKWVEKFVQHGNGIMLINLAKSAWFNALWESAHGITLLPSTMKFHTPTHELKPILMPTGLFAMGADNVRALSKIGHSR